MTDAASDIPGPWAIRRGGAIVTDGDGVWPWWSITKTVLAVALLRLFDQRRIALVEPTRFHRATLQQLLTHTGGVPSYTRLPDYAEAVERRTTAWSMDEMLERMARQEDDFPPGQGWSYSNTGYAFVRRAVEEALDDDIAGALGRVVFDPLGLTDTALVLSAEDDHCALLQAERYDPGWVWPAAPPGMPYVSLTGFSRTTSFPPRPKPC